MTTWIAFLRGVNVGATRRLPMKPLAERLSALGLARVRTYIQSGNLVFDALDGEAQALADTVADAIDAGFGFRPPVHLLSTAALRAAVESCPFVPTDPKGHGVHLYFLAQAPDAVDRPRLDALRVPDERWHLADRVFYLNTPAGLSDSRLAAQAERLLGVSATARNWRTVQAVLDLAEAGAPSAAA